jgi:hypothetical protein
MSDRERPPSRDGGHAMKRGANPDTSRDAASSLSSNAVSSIVPGSGADGMMLSAARIRAQAVGAASRGDWLSSADYEFAERIEGRVRTKELPSYRTEVGAGRELIDRESVGIPGLVDTVAHPDYVAADASRDRLELANEARALGSALDAADSIQAQDSLEKMLVHEMAVLHRGMMKAAARMNEELDAAGVMQPSAREAANVRACRLAGAISRMSSTFQQAVLTLQRKRTGGRQHVTVTHVYQQVNIEDGGQAVVAGNEVTSGRVKERRKERRGAMAGGPVENGE